MITVIMNTTYNPVPGEKEILQLRHVHLRQYLILGKLVFQGIIPLILGGVAFLVFGHIDFVDTFFSLIVAGYHTYLCILVLLSFMEWYNHEMDILILTNKRII